MGSIIDQIKLMYEANPFTTIFAAVCIILALSLLVSVNKMKLKALLAALLIVMAILLFMRTGPIF